MIKHPRTQTVVGLAKWFCFMVAVFLLCLRCPAQIATAELDGSVLDSTGAAVPNATVTATNVETAIAHKTVSGKNGEYVITDLPPGDYTLTVEAAGFRNSGGTAGRWS